MTKLTVYFLSVLLLVGCAASQLITVKKEKIQSSVPAIGEESAGNLGDTLLVQTEKLLTPGIGISEKVDVDWLGGFTVLPQRVPAWYADKLGNPDYFCCLSTLGLKNQIIRITYSAEKDLFCMNEVKIGREHCPAAFNESIKRTNIEDENALIFQQELIYNGRVGDQLKFIYREFNAATARSAFTQNAQYDLKESNIIGFKNARLEILEANNRLIRYKVISNFR